MRSVEQCIGRCLRLEGFERAEHAVAVRVATVLALLAMALRLFFWGFTQRYWEDALITCLHAENFVRGLGLSHFRPGEAPLHGFTSPLSVLVPLLGDLVHVGFGVEFLKLVSIPASALTIYYILAIGIHPKVRLGTPLTALLMGYAAFEHHQILFGMAGMETQLSVLILLMSVYYCLAWKTIPLGISLGLCMLVRPDYGFWTIIVGVYGLAKAPRALLTRVVPVAVALYAPWIVFTTWYYGSPLPHTIVAKGLGYAAWWEKAGGVTFGTVKREIWLKMAEHLHVMLGPSFHGHGAGMHLFFTEGPESPVGNLMFVLAAVGTLAIVLRRQWPLVPLVACVAVYSLYYIFLVPTIFPWYKMPYLILLLLLSARGLQALAAVIPKPTLRRALLSVFAVAYVGLFLGVLPWTFLTERQIQRHIENPVRKAAGLWLRERIEPGEAVGCEPLGYMGYYSGANVYDWPGLDSRRVVEWSKANPGRRCLENMLHDLRPEYLFLRDAELLYWFKDAAWIRADYHVEAVFQVDPEQAQRIRWIDRNSDTHFRIYKKNRPGDVTPYDDALWPRLPEEAPRTPQPSAWATSS